MKYFDISPLIEPQIAVFPGDQKFERNILLDTNQGDHLSLSSIRTTVHVGAHVDAPCHYGVYQEGIHQRSLEYYFGLAQVITVKKKPEERIYPEDISAEIKAPRLLFSTGSFPNPNLWTDQFNSLSPELIHWGAKKGVKLFGIDTPSVDPAASKELETHQALLETNSAVLEGIVLSSVPDGIYILSALPLSLKDSDASPVRAVLWEPKEFQKWSSALSD